MSWQGANSGAISLWFNASQHDNYVISEYANGPNQAMYVRETGNLINSRWYIDGAGEINIASIGEIALNKWVHVCFSYNGSRAFLKVNGSAPRDGNRTGTIGIGSTAGVYIGRLNAVYWEGNIDEVSLWRNNYLTEADCDDLYNAGAGIYYEDYETGTNYSITATSGS